MVKLTAMEIKVLNAMRQNEYNDALADGYTWTMTAIDNSGINGQTARGVISSLVQKGLVWVEKGDKSKGDEDSIGFTDKGKALFDNADGKDCDWGGAKLLKEIQNKGEVTKMATKKVVEAKKEAKKEVEIVAFTGMALGKFPVVAETEKTLTVEMKKGQAKFDKKTGAQTDAKNPKFANRIKK